MEVKVGICCPTYLLMIVAVWVTNCHAVPPHSKLVDLNENSKAVSAPAAQSSTINGNGKLTSATTINPLMNGKGPREAFSAFTQRNKRDISDSKAHFGMFPDVRNADDALQKLYLLLAMTKAKNTVGTEEYDEDFDDTPIDLVLGKEPGSIRSAGGMRPKPKGSLIGNGEEPTGVPIVLYQHHMHKKSSPSNVIPPEIFIREAAPSYEPDQKIMTKLLERFVFNRNLRSQIDGGRFYSVGQLLEQSSRLNNGIAAIPRLVL